MPRLKQLDCFITWKGTNARVPEYRTRVTEDMTVETYIGVPEEPAEFAIHLQSKGWIAPGLAMFVYIDGQYQCNRNRTNLKLPNQTSVRKKVEVHFEVSQREVRLTDGTMWAQPWRFEELLLVPDDEEYLLHPAPYDGEFLGKIDVVVLRCYAEPKKAPKTGSRRQRNSEQPICGLDGADDRALSLLQHITGLDGPWDYDETSRTSRRYRQQGRKGKRSSTPHPKALIRADSSVSSWSSDSSSTSTEDERAAAPSVVMHSGSKAKITVNQTGSKSRRRGRSTDRGREQCPIHSAPQQNHKTKRLIERRQIRARSGNALRSISDSSHMSRKGPSKYVYISEGSSSSEAPRKRGKTSSHMSRKGSSKYMYTSDESSSSEAPHKGTKASTKSNSGVNNAYHTTRKSKLYRIRDTVKSGETPEWSDQESSEEDEPSWIEASKPKERRQGRKTHHLHRGRDKTIDHRHTIESGETLEWSDQESSEENEPSWIEASKSKERRHGRKNHHLHRGRDKTTDHRSRTKEIGWTSEDASEQPVDKNGIWGHDNQTWQHNNDNANNSPSNTNWEENTWGEDTSQQQPGGGFYSWDQDSQSRQTQNVDGNNSPMNPSWGNALEEIASRDDNWGQNDQSRQHQNTNTQNIPMHQNWEGNVSGFGNWGQNYQTQQANEGFNNSPINLQHGGLEHPVETNYDQGWTNHIQGWANHDQGGTNHGQGWSQEGPSRTKNKPNNWDNQSFTRDRPDSPGLQLPSNPGSTGQTAAASPIPEPIIPGAWPPNSAPSLEKGLNPSLAQDQGSVTQQPSKALQLFRKSTPTNDDPHTNLSARSNSILGTPEPHPSVSEIGQHSKWGNERAPQPSGADLGTGRSNTGPNTRVQRDWPHIQLSPRDRPIFDPNAKETPLYTVPQEVAARNEITHQMNPGTPELFTHSKNAPKYMDTHDNPYAVFTFYYAFRDAIEKRLGVEVLESEHQERERMLGLPTEELVDRIFRKEAPSKASASNTTEGAMSEDTPEPSPGSTPPALPSQDNIPGGGKPDINAQLARIRAKAQGLLDSGAQAKQQNTIGGEQGGMQEPTIPIWDGVSQMGNVGPGRNDVHGFGRGLLNRLQPLQNDPARANIRDGPHNSPQILNNNPAWGPTGGGLPNSPQPFDKSPVYANRGGVALNSPQILYNNPSWGPTGRGLPNSPQPFDKSPVYANRGGVALNSPQLGSNAPAWVGNHNSPQPWSGLQGLNQNPGDREIGWLQGVNQKLTDIENPNLGLNESNGAGYPEVEW